VSQDTKKDRHLMSPAWMFGLLCGWLCSVFHFLLFSPLSCKSTKHMYFKQCRQDTGTSVIPDVRFLCRDATVMCQVGPLERVGVGLYRASAFPPSDGAPLLSHGV
jgi:hypothetical protein